MASANPNEVMLTHAGGTVLNAASLMAHVPLPVGKGVTPLKTITAVESQSTDSSGLLGVLNFAATSSENARGDLLD